MPLFAGMAQGASAPTRCERAEILPGQYTGLSAFDWSTQPAKAGTPVPFRIGLWGDSLTSSPDFMDAALGASAIPAASVLPSFIQAGMKVAGLRLPLRASCATEGWQAAYAHKDPHATAGFSQGMLSMRAGSPGEAVFLDFRAPQPSTRVAALTVLYEKPAPDSSLLLAVSIDGAAEKLVSLSRVSGGTLAITPAQPMATIRLRVVSGQATLHGFVPRYEHPPVVVLDTMSVPGGLLRGWSHVDARIIAGTLPDYDLVLVQYGTNEGAAPGFRNEKYRAYLHANLARLRLFYPRARCILIGPPDRGTLAPASPDALKNAFIHHQIAQAQQQVAPAYRCSFWNWQLAMGGPGAALRWFQMTPPRMQPDLTHMTAAGYAASGRLFGTTYPLHQP